MRHVCMGHVMYMCMSHVTSSHIYIGPVTYFLYTWKRQDLPTDMTHSHILREQWLIHNWDSFYMRHICTCHIIYTCMGHVTESYLYMGHVTYFFYAWNTTHSQTYLIPICTRDVTYSHVRHGSFVCATHMYGHVIYMVNHFTNISMKLCNVNSHIIYIVTSGTWLILMCDAYVWSHYLHSKSHYKYICGIV